MSVAPLLIEIGCEEIPARMIPAAAKELGRIVPAILDRAGLAHGAARGWGAASSRQRRRPCAPRGSA